MGVSSPLTGRPQTLGFILVTLFVLKCDGASTKEDMHILEQQDLGEDAVSMNPNAIDPMKTTPQVIYC